MTPGAPIPTDFELMARVGNGDPDAFRLLVERHQTPLLNFFVRLGVSTPEDLAQETFVKIWNYRSQYRPDAKFTTFLYTVARRVANDAWRSASRFAAARERYRLQAPPSSDGGLPRLRKDLDIRTALDSLSPAHRETLVLAACQGLSYQEISEVLGIPVGTVKSRVFNALSALEKTFREDR